MKPGAIGRHRVAFDFVDLPAEGRKGAAPRLPPLREWSTETLRLWREVWRKPQATMWHDVEAVVPLAIVWQDLQVLAPERTAALLAELRQVENALGLGPRALAQLRWRVVSDEVAERRRTTPSAVPGSLPTPDGVPSPRDRLRRSTS